MADFFAALAENGAIIWLVALIVLLVIEIITVGLTTIWFAGGALVSLILSAAGAGMAWQIAVFLVISVVLLVFTRPFAVKYINRKREKTNYEGVIGKVVRITETVSNINATGTALTDGKVWTVRSKDDSVTLEAGSMAKVVEIAGVKLIVEEYKED